VFPKIRLRSSCSHKLPVETGKATVTAGFVFDCRVVDGDMGESSSQLSAISFQKRHLLRSAFPNSVPRTGYWLLLFDQITAAKIVVVAINPSELKHKMHQTPSTCPSM
jgi:hypothetical protein